MGGAETKQEWKPSEINPLEIRDRLTTIIKRIDMNDISFLEAIYIYGSDNCKRTLIISNGPDTEASINFRLNHPPVYDTEAARFFSEMISFVKFITKFSIKYQSYSGLKFEEFYGQ